jgi:hypothetical protein
VSEEKEEPRDETAEEETAVPLPERDAMTIIAGPGSLVPIDGGVAVDPTSPETGTDKLAPPPGFTT